MLLRWSVLTGLSLYELLRLSWEEALFLVDTGHTRDEMQWEKVRMIAWTIAASSGADINSPTDLFQLELDKNYKAKAWEPDPEREEKVKRIFARMESQQKDKDDGRQ